MENAGYNLFLDDLRTPLDAYSYTQNTKYISENWEIVRTYGEFVTYILKYGLPNLISFDHDLGKEAYDKCNHGGEIDYDSLTEKTGYDCAKWLVNHLMDQGNLEVPFYYVHTMNPVGGQNISKLLENYTKMREK